MEEEVGRLWVQSAEVYTVEELCLGAEKRGSGIKVGWSRLQARRAIQVVRHGAARRQGACRKLHKQRPGQPGGVACGRVGVQRQHAWWPGTQQHGKLLRSKCGPNSMRRTSRRPSRRIGTRRRARNFGRLRTHLHPQRGNVAYGRGRAG